ncbi:alcohol dehydrogenase catalytic domain-containing protein [Mycobacterium sp. 141]|uniref:alcohol dehydrogenase catalytic domain-containing protein n=1 Tax=Mycobacterium sp. 141 TaxID=1120797 RepID=UPI00036DAB82|nr:alcohol dehydrogenase catalytic domain-containing protein [Mycobacterium sp. 141]
MVSSAVVMRVDAPGGPLEPHRVTLTSPQRGWVRVAVAACGVCNADIGTAKAGGGAQLPVTPGHEVAGVIAEVGEGVDGWVTGDRVAVGWFGGSCGHCGFCRRGDVVHCPERKIPGLSYPGGWAESITVPADALARIPDGLDLDEAAPMGCAGVTTFNAIRQANIGAGGRVAVFGLGGLGHLAVQFAAAMGYDVCAIARGPERADIARQLGACSYIDSQATAPGAALHASGGADLIISTVPTTEPVAELIQGLRVHGRLTLIGVDGGSLQIPAAQLVMNSQVITGHLTGSPADTEEAMRFAHINGVRPLIERMPLQAAGQAVDRLRSGKPRFRIVLVGPPPR